MATEFGYKVIIQAEVDAKLVTVTPPTTPGAGSKPRADVEKTRTTLQKTNVHSAPRVVVVSGNNLDVTLKNNDVVGDVVHWVSYS